MQVLVVCTANVARSPLAAAMLQHELGPEVQVGSAGTRARDGSAAAPESVRLGEERRLDLHGHRSRPVSPAVAAGADLVLTMSERQRDHVAPLAPRMAGRVFTLLEFDRLCGAVDPSGAPTGSVAERLTWWRDRAHGTRPMAPPAEASEDVADPIGRPWEHWLALAEVLDAVVPRLGARARPV